MGTEALRLDPVSGPSIDPIRVDAGRVHIVGRTDAADVRLPHTQVSKEHARLERGDDGWRIVDLDSHNGVYVDSIRIEPGEPTVLRDQFVLGIRPWTFIVRTEDDERDEPTPGVDPPAADPPAARPAGADAYSTRATIFLRLRDTDTDRRELSWQEFSERYGPVIRGFARNAGLPAQEADDILQDVLLGFFRVSSTFEYDPARGRFRGYLKRVTLNAIRAQHRRRRPEVQPETGVVFADRDATQTMWGFAWSKNVVERALAEVAERFEPVTFQAFELYGRRGVPMDAVAEQLGISPASVRQAKSRVMKAVREAIERIRAAEG